MQFKSNFYPLIGVGVVDLLLEVLTGRTTMTRKNYNEDKRVKEEKTANSHLTIPQFYMRPLDWH